MTLGASNIPIVMRTWSVFSVYPSVDNVTSSWSGCTHTMSSVGDKLDGGKGGPGMLSQGVV